MFLVNDYTFLADVTSPAHPGKLLYFVDFAEECSTSHADLLWRRDPSGSSSAAESLLLTDTVRTRAAASLYNHSLVTEGRTADASGR